MQRDSNAPLPPDRTSGPLSLALVILLLATSVASAHTEHDAGGGFVAGFEHPITGLDHVVAMVAVGLWGAFLGSRATWLLPVVFPMVMAIGGALGVAGVPIPKEVVETAIALSAIVLGIMVAFKLKPPLWVAAIIVGFFAIFHGHAHGAELPDNANPLAYSAGFVIATGLLHLCGIAFGLLAKWPWGQWAVRGGGVIVAGIGIYFLTQALMHEKEAPGAPKEASVPESNNSPSPS